MKRRALLGAAGSAGLVGVTAVDLFAPELIVGSPQADGKPIATERTVTDADIEFLPDQNAVRWPGLVGTDGAVEKYEVEPFEQWAGRRAATVAHDTVEFVLPERIDGEAEGVGVSVSGEYLGLAVMVSTVIPRDENGEPDGEPAVSRATLVNAAPRYAETTVRLDGREHTRRVPVFVEERPEAVPL
ncbi:hypothetical protein [Halolamina salifodinae]|uniref:Uncharacterized protein n=1 Tax=Halolamina salifodinae TaxID=1202767 RepID=A0A8T4GW34_9EURY|nr:hypothetical protein [Halolamina salifodinae]MBP1986273.1 hypothetical protein [Halolamina salifodinae]